MTRHMFWQTALAVLGIGLVFALLYRSGGEPVPIEQVPAAGGTYVEAVLGSARRINPILSPRMVQANPVEQDIAALVFDGLTTLDSSGQVTASLAIDWQVSEDGTVYEFRLRPDVSWHDGAPVTSNDVVFTVQSIQDPGFRGDRALQSLWRNVVVEPVDGLAVRFVLAEPFPSFLYYTTIGLLPAHLLGNVPATSLPEHALSTSQPVGTGMFEVESVQPDRISLVANPHYWGPKPYLERLEFWFYDNETEIIKDYDLGQVQGFHPDEEKVLSELGALRGGGVHTALEPGCSLVYLNLQRDDAPFLKVREVRQALLYGLDRQALIDKAADGLGLVADSPILPTLWAHDDGVRQYGYDPQRAIGLLDASGWLDSNGNRIRDKDGVELSFDLLTGNDSTSQKLAGLMAEEWLALGVEARVRVRTPTDVAALVRSRDYQSALVEIGLTADPDPYPLWHSTQAADGGQNFASFSNETADLMMEEARLTRDPQRRLELYREFQRLLAEEVPALLVYYPIYSYVVSSQVRDVQMPPLLYAGDRFRNLVDWYVNTEERPIIGTAELDKPPNK